MADSYPYYEYRAKRRVVGREEPDETTPERDPNGPYPCVMEAGDVAYGDSPADAQEGWTFLYAILFGHAAQSVGWCKVEDFDITGPFEVDRPSQA